MALTTLLLAATMSTAPNARAEITQEQNEGDRAVQLLLHVRTAQDERASRIATESTRPAPAREEPVLDPAQTQPTTQTSEVSGSWTADWQGVADCETGDAHVRDSANWAYDGPSGFDGGLQFTSSTWRGYGGGEFAPYAWGATPEQQMTVAERVKADQGMGAWPHCRIYA